MSKHPESGLIFNHITVGTEASRPKTPASKDNVYAFGREAPAPTVIPESSKLSPIIHFSLIKSSSTTRLSIIKFWRSIVFFPI